MGAWEGGSTPDTTSLEFLDDLDTLPAQRLREKYKSEASSHRNMLRRQSQGFEVDPAWLDFRDFLRSMGPKPSDGMRRTIDRLDPDLRRYGPELCRWATDDEQTANRSNTIWLTHRGERMRLKDAAELEGITYKRAHYLWQTGQPIGEKKPSNTAGGRYCPMRYLDDPDGLAAWHDKYRKWVTRVHSDRKHLAPPEVFDIIKTSWAYCEVRKVVETQIIELAPSEMHEADAFGASLAGSIYRNAFDWIDHAIAALTERNPKLAKTYNQAVPRMYWEYWHWEKYLTADLNSKPDQS